MSRFLAARGHHIKNTDVKTLIDFIDKDKDGKVSFNDFIEFKPRDYEEMIAKLHPENNADAKARASKKMNDVFGILDS